MSLKSSLTGFANFYSIDTCWLNLRTTPPPFVSFDVDAMETDLLASLLSKIFHGLAGRQTLGGFPGTLMVLNDGLWLMERLVLVLECLGHFW